MRTLIALLALLTLTACGAADEAEQRDPRCDYQDDREWAPLKVYDTDACSYAWFPYEDDCRGQGCRVKCGGVSADERQANYEAAVLDMIAADYVDIMVTCGQPDGSVDPFTCRGTARVLIGEGGCTTDTNMIPTTISTPDTNRDMPGYSAVWQIPAE